MKYLCLIYIDEARREATPGDELTAVRNACTAHTAELEQRGQYLASERLESVRTATTVRRDGDKVSITDGPFAETKEQLAGFYLIEADNLDEAINIAQDIPPGRLGAVEVRPVRPD